LSAVVNRYVGANKVFEELKNFARLGMAIGGMLGKQQLSVNLNIKYSLFTHPQGDIGDDMLVIMNEIGNRAHGAI